MSGKIIRKCSWRTLRNTVENTIGNTVDELGDVSEINLGVADRSGQDRELKQYHICCPQSFSGGGLYLKGSGYYGACMMGYYNCVLRVTMSVYDGLLWSVYDGLL